MRAYLKRFLLSAITAGVAWLASRAFVPGAVAVADIEQQPQWHLQLAFVLNHRIDRPRRNGAGAGGRFSRAAGTPLCNAGGSLSAILRMTVAVHRESLP